MIIPRGIQPDKSLYTIGASVVNVLKDEKKKEIELDMLYTLFCKTHPRHISFSYFLYALDWLFLIGLVEVGSVQSKVKKCF